MKDSSLSLAAVDADGAMQETGEAIGLDTRAGLLRKAGLGLGAVAAGSAFAGALPAVARAAVPASDIAILNFALTLEELEAAFYAEAVAGGRLRGEALRFARVVAQHEATHVRFLRRTLGAKAVAKPRFDFKGTTADQAKFLATAQVLEDTGVRVPRPGREHQEQDRAPRSRPDPAGRGAPRCMGAGHPLQRWHHAADHAGAGRIRGRLHEGTLAAVNSIGSIVS